MAKVLERSLYETDYYAWTKAKAAELRRMAERRVNSALDLENLAEEVESLGRSDLNRVRSQIRRIVEHLLKLEFSPSALPRADWRHSVAQARDEVEDHIDGQHASGRGSRSRQTLRPRPARSAFALAKHASPQRQRRCPRPAPTASTRSSVTAGTRQTGTG